MSIGYTSIIMGCTSTVVGCTSVVVAWTEDMRIVGSIIKVLRQIGLVFFIFNYQ